MKRLGLIVARARPSNAIGYNNQLLFRIKEDMQHFKRTTMGHPVIMGRKTYESIGRPLPGRDNVVLSRTLKGLDGAVVCRSLEDALVCVTDRSMPYVIGGGEVYDTALPLVTDLVLTEVHRDAEQADTFFHFLVEDFDLVQRVVGETHGVVFKTYQRKGIE